MHTFLHALLLMRKNYNEVTRRFARHLILVVALGAMLSSASCAMWSKHRASRYAQQGGALLERQELEAALAMFEEAIELDPQLAVAHSKMGRIYRRMGKYESAIGSFVKAIQIDPFAMDDSYNLGQLYQFTHRLTEAIRAYLHAVELNPHHFDTQLNLGVCYQQTGEYDQAADRYEAAIKINPHQPHAYVNLGVVYDEQQRYYDAIRLYKEALERDSRQPLVLVNLARTYLHQDRLKIAKMTLKYAVSMDPELEAAHEALGYCLFRLQDFEGSRRAYMSAISNNWRLPRSHAGLGSIYMLRFLEDETLLADRDKALEHWHQSLELEPDQPRLDRLIAMYKPKRNDPVVTLLRE